MITEAKTRQLHGGVTVVEISGRLNLGISLISIETAIKRLIEQGARKLVVDLSHVNYIDSSGIGMLVACAGQMEQSNGRMRISGTAGAVAKVFEVVHMERITPLDETVDASAAAFVEGGL